MILISLLQKIIEKIKKQIDKSKHIHIVFDIPIDKYFATCVSEFLQTVNLQIPNIQFNNWQISQQAVDVDVQKQIIPKQNGCDDVLMRPTILALSIKNLDPSDIFDKLIRKINEVFQKHHNIIHKSNNKI